jgi:hypothetical protein
MNNSVVLPGAVAESPKGILTVGVGDVRGLGPVRRPYLVMTFGHNEFIARGPEESGFPDLHVSDSGGRPVDIPTQSVLTRSRSGSTPRVSARTSQQLASRAMKWDAKARL